MRVLVTGHRGHVGTAVTAHLAGTGVEVTGYDLTENDDVLDLDRLCAAARGCDRIVHLAANLGHADETDEEILATNVTGTRNVLLAAERLGAERVVFMSSVNALGIFMGERPPDYLPIDDAHPCHPVGAYGISKLASEEMCRLCTHRTGIATLCLRPPAVWNDEQIESIRAARARDPAFEWTPFWEYGCFVHVDDLARATTRALTCANPGHVRLLLSADDISSAGLTSRELAERVHPQVPWCGGAEYDEEPYRSLVRAETARRVLDWQPRYRWRGDRAGDTPPDEHPSGKDVS